MAQTINNVYQSVTAFVTTLLPPQVRVVEGENYGIRLEDPTTNGPIVAVNLEDIAEESLELGSASAAYVVSCTVNALSRLQRDAMKQILFSGLVYSAIPLYDYSAPISSGVYPQVGELEVQYGIRIQDMPDFNSGRERFFWSAVVFFTVHCLTV